MISESRDTVIATAPHNPIDALLVAGERLRRDVNDFARAFLAPDICELVIKAHEAKRSRPKAALAFSF